MLYEEMPGGGGHSCVVDVACCDREVGAAACQRALRGDAKRRRPLAKVDLPAAVSVHDSKGAQRELRALNVAEHEQLHDLDAAAGIGVNGRKHTAKAVYGRLIAA